MRTVLRTCFKFAFGRIHISNSAYFQGFVYQTPLLGVSQTFRTATVMRREYSKWNAKELGNVLKNDGYRVHRQYFISVASLLVILIILAKRRKFLNGIRTNMNERQDDRNVAVPIPPPSIVSHLAKSKTEECEETVIRIFSKGKSTSELPLLRTYLNQIKDLRNKGSKEIQKKKVEFSDSWSKSDFIVIIGSTGTGKSTLTNYLCGAQLERKKEDMIVVKEGTKSYVDIAKKKEATTYIPQFVRKDAKNKKEEKEYRPIICDFPGFYDTRGVPYNIAHAYNMKFSFENARNVKFVLLLEYAGLTSRHAEHCNSDLSLVSQHLKGKLENDDCLKSVFIIITKVPKCYDSKHVKNKFLDSLDDENREIFERFAENNVFIYDPLDDKEYGNERMKRGQILSLLKSGNSVFSPGDFRFALCDKLDTDLRKCELDCKESVMNHFEIHNDGELKSLKDLLKDLKELEGLAEGSYRIKTLCGSIREDCCRRIRRGNRGFAELVKKKLDFNEKIAIARRYWKQKSFLKDYLEFQTLDAEIIELIKGGYDLSPFSFFGRYASKAEKAAPIVIPLLLFSFLQSPLLFPVVKLIDFPRLGACKLFGWEIASKVTNRYANSQYVYYGGIFGVSCFATQFYIQNYLKTNDMVEDLIRIVKEG